MIMHHLGVLLYDLSVSLVERFFSLSSRVEYSLDHGLWWIRLRTCGTGFSGYLGNSLAKAMENG